MDAEIQRMWELIGSLSDAFWRRLKQPGVNVLDALRLEEYRPQSNEEKAIWTEITAPNNYASLRHYIESKKRSEITDYAAKLYETLLMEATHRWEEEKEKRGRAREERGKERGSGERKGGRGSLLSDQPLLSEPE